MKKNELDEILENHKLFLNNNGGKKANLCDTDLAGANLTGANLTRADLTGANLYSANLTRADLTRADLYDTDLTRANLTGANLYSANLTSANLTGANLYSANLTGANLYSANLTGAKQKIILIIGSRHSICAIDDDVRIGCEHHSLANWFEQFHDTGKKANYTLEQIEEYGIYLKTIEAVLKLYGKIK